MNIIINQLQKNFGPKVAVDIENYSIQSVNMLGLWALTEQEKRPCSA